MWKLAGFGIGNCFLSIEQWKKSERKILSYTKLLNIYVPKTLEKLGGKWQGKTNNCNKLEIQWGNVPLNIDKMFLCKLKKEKQWQIGKGKK